MRTAQLLGREHPRVGAIATVAEGRAAIALSAGGACKTYEHTDPDEDAVAFAVGRGGILVVACDAHFGAAASERAVSHVLETWAPVWLEASVPSDWSERARGALWETHEAVLRETQLPDRQGSRTTLALAVVRPGEGRALVAAVGDSHVFGVGRDATRDLSAPARPCPPRFFLGSESLVPQQLAEAALVTEVPLRGLRAVALATDGLSERGVGVPDPELAVAEAAARALQSDPALRPLEAARAIAEAANAAHARNPSGDNIAAAVVWLEGAE